MKVTLRDERILVGVNDASTMLKLSRVTIYKLINSGAVCAVKSGHRTLIPVQGLRDYADSLSPYVPPAVDEKV